MSLSIPRVLCAYAGAYLLAGLLGRPLHAIFGLLRIVSTVVAGMLIFLIVTIGFKLLTAKIRRKRIKQKLDTGRGELSLPLRGWRVEVRSAQRCSMGEAPQKNVGVNFQLSRLYWPSISDLLHLPSYNPHLEFLK